jgi:formylmethanofuran dehydrogenase subunit C
MLLKNNMVMNNNSKTEVEGSITVNGNVQLNPGSKLRLHGSITISGNLHLAGAIEFIGTGNAVVINGNVNSTTGFSVTGNYSSNVPLQ